MINAGLARGDQVFVSLVQVHAVLVPFGPIFGCFQAVEFFTTLDAVFLSAPSSRIQKWGDVAMGFVEIGRKFWN